jgi:hypothetical protein
VTKALLQAYQTQHSRDPIEAARAAVDIANNMVDHAHSEAERIQAYSALDTANRQLLAAQQDVTYAWLEQLESYYNIIGDSVDAAKAGLQLAQKKLDDVLADPNAGDAEKIRALTAVNEANARVRDAQLKQGESDIDIALQLERITTGQAIAQLQALLQIPNLTTEQTNEVLLKIKQLQGELSRDLQFNLPSEIRVPTAYEVRRISGQGGSSSNYQDNRQISVQVYAQTNATPAQIGAAVATAVGGGRTTGTTVARRYT